jgi:iron complex outermembrane receptor protein
MDKLTGTVGFRWTKETKTGTNRPSVRCVGAGGPPFCPPLQDSATFTRELLFAQPGLFVPPIEILDSNNKEWGSRFALDYQMSDDVLLYASISRGFKGGGFSIAALQALLGLAGQAVEPEVLWAYEAGFKTNWQDGALQLNGSVYYYDWKNLQTFQPLLDPALGIAVPQLLNVPASSMIGGELEIQWAFGEGWYLAAGINVNDAEFDDVGNIVTATVGNPLINNPDFSHTGLLRKEIPMANGVLALQTNWRYKGAHTFDLANSPALSQEGYWNLAARASYTFGQNEDYVISVWGDNLTGEEVCRGKTSLEGLTEAILCLAAFSEPTFGITAHYNFN